MDEFCFMDISGGSEQLMVSPYDSECDGSAADFPVSSSCGAPPSSFSLFGKPFLQGFNPICYRDTLTFDINGKEKFCFSFSETLGKISALCFAFGFGCCLGYCLGERKKIANWIKSKINNVKK